MFGRLAASLCRHAPRTVVSRRMRRITPAALMGALPGLGSVLYLHDASNETMPRTLPHGLLVPQRECLPLLEAHWLAAVSVVTDDGPREWCECVDRFGRTRARWHLLPDTDYLAWDALGASGMMIHHDPVDTKPLRTHRASVVSFRLLACAGLQVLEQHAVAALSPLGNRVAARIAHAESVYWDG